MPPLGYEVYQLEVDGKGVVFSTLKKAEGKDGLILRLYNVSENETEARIYFGIPSSVVYRANLNEEIVDEIAFEENELSLPLEKGQIETLLIQNRKPGEARR